jgi:hypothetical protein
MHQLLLYSSLFFAFLAFLLGCLACARVGNFIKATKDLDWDSIANITGDLATTKKTIQTLNNRLNGMHSPKLADQELMLQLMQSKGGSQPNGKITDVGG